MLQRNSEYIYREKQDEDMPLEGKKTCMAEAYKEKIYNVSEVIEVETKILN